ncbi:MAG: MinD/ParA family protein [Gallionellaceae bacterium]|nr:MAG: MinD/ParA family protein [Gallionellaceae bacterium]
MLHDTFSAGYLTSVPSPQPSPIGGGGDGEKQFFDSDQAEGLRRLLARSAARVVTVVGARSGLGATSVVVNLAAAWARSGKDVLVLDEHLTQNNVANTLALKPRYDLLNVVRGDKTLREVMLRGSDGVQILPVARAMQALPRLGEDGREQLLESLTQAARGMDVVLVDAAARAGHSVCASLSGDEPLMLVLNGTASGITESYAMLKQMALHNGRQTFDIAVNKINDAGDARAIFDNMAQLAWRNLQVRLGYMGYIPVDEKLKRATQLCRPVVEAFPSAQGSVAFGELAHNLMHAKNVTDEKMSGLTRVMQRLIRQAHPLSAVSAIT